MRWFGPDDPVRLAHIRQVPLVRGVVSSVSGVPAGEAWTRDQVIALQEPILAAGLTLDVIESIPVSEETKLGGADAERHTEAWCASLEAAAAAAGIKTVCYNFMPVSDWVRTELAMPLPDGSTTLAYDDGQMPEFERRVFSGKAKDIPAWDHLDLNQFATLRDRYTARGESGLWDALGAFLDRVTPAAESLGIHPDDPCWSVLGLPRIITSPAAMRRVCDLVDSASNGITFCTGSLGCDPANDLVAGARDLASRVSFVHARNESAACTPRWGSPEMGLEKPTSINSSASPVRTPMLLFSSRCGAGRISTNSASRPGSLPLSCPLDAGGI